MENRTKINNLHQKLITTSIQRLFGQISPVNYLTVPPIPLTTDEMHKKSGEMIMEATREVLLEFYKFTAESDGGKEIYDALNKLKQKADFEKQEINVYFLINSRGTAAQYLYKKNTLNIQGLSSSQYFKITVTLHTTNAFGSLHTKMIIVDSKIAMIRGGDPHTANNRSEHQFETATVISGPLVSIMRKDFGDVWEACTREKFKLFDIMTTETEISEKKNSTSIPCIFMSKRANENLIPFYYQGCEAPYKIALLEAIRTATASINIMTSNLNDPQICDALANACRNGINVNIVMGKYHNDTSEAYWGGTNLASVSNIIRQLAKEHLEYLFVRWATNSHGNLVDNCAKFTIHAKYICIDNALIFIGSSPLDYQAMYYSREADLVFEDSKTALQFNEKFFRNKFENGLDCYEDIFFILYYAIEQQAKRMENTANSPLKNAKASQLRESLYSMRQDTNSYPKKIYSLLKIALPVLKIKTGNKPGLPFSYNTIFSLLQTYGFDTHISAILKTQQPDHNLTVSGFILFPSNSNLNKKTPLAPEATRDNNCSPK